MRKYIVRDEDKEYEVEEIETTEKVDDEPASEPESLSTEDIKALKALAAISDKLVALVNVEKDEHAGEPAAEMLDEDEDVEEDIDEETIVDTDEDVEKMLGRDSKKSVGSIVKAAKKIDDSCEDAVAIAWAKRYGGIK